MKFNVLRVEYFSLFSSSDFNLYLSILQDYNEYFRDLNVSVEPFCKECWALAFANNIHPLDV